MPSATATRLQIEAVLAHRIPCALTPRPKMVRPVAPTGVTEVDELLEGGLPLGAITEMVGPESSGRTAAALSFVSRVTHSGSVCAWIDVCNALCPESAAEAGIDLARMLWVRCGVTAERPQTTAYKFALPAKYTVAAPIIKGLHGGGCGGHPRNEVKRMPKEIGDLLRPAAIAVGGVEAEPTARLEGEALAPYTEPRAPKANVRIRTGKPWERIEQAMRVTDLLLQAGGFKAIVLDMAGIAPEYVSRVPLATWFRYRAAAERTQASLVLLTQYSCAKSSGELLLRFQMGEARSDEATVFTGIEHRLEVERSRFTQEPTNVVPMRKPPQSVKVARWRSQSAWVGAR